MSGGERRGGERRLLPEAGIEPHNLSIPSPVPFNLPGTPAPYMVRKKEVRHPSPFALMAICFVKHCVHIFTPDWFLSVDVEDFRRLFFFIFFNFKIGK